MIAMALLGATVRTGIWVYAKCTTVKRLSHRRSLFLLWLCMLRILICRSAP